MQFNSSLTVSKCATIPAARANRAAENLFNFILIRAASKNSLSVIITDVFPKLFVYDFKFQLTTPITQIAFVLKIIYVTAVTIIFDHFIRIIELFRIELLDNRLFVGIITWFYVKAFKLVNESTFLKTHILLVLRVAGIRCLLG